jgi:phosphoribosyl 1,2-cyclic phosphodiesterase
MIVTFHGVRGSMPCQSDAVAGHGGNTSCVSIAAPGEDALLFDLGTGLRYFADSLPPGRPFRGTALLSHLHWDHVQGLPFFRPLLCDGAELVIHAPAQSDGRHPGDVLLTTIRPPMFPIELNEIGGAVTFYEAKPEFSVGGYLVRSADVPHNGPTCGYRVELAGRSVAYVCDHQQPPTADARTDVVADSVVDLCEGVDLLIHDAQYTRDEFLEKSTWGHCTHEYAVRVAAASGAKRLALFHHDPFHDDDAIAAMTAEAETLGAAVGVDVFAAVEGASVDLAPR